MGFPTFRLTWRRSSKGQLSVAHPSGPPALPGRADQGREAHPCIWRGLPSPPRGPLRPPLSRGLSLGTRGLARWKPAAWTAEEEHLPPAAEHLGSFQVSSSVCFDGPRCGAYAFHFHGSIHCTCMPLFPEVFYVHLPIYSCRSRGPPQALVSHDNAVEQTARPEPSAAFGSGLCCGRSTAHTV